MPGTTGLHIVDFRGYPFAGDATGASASFQAKAHEVR